MKRKNKNVRLINVDLLYKENASTLFLNERKEDE